MFFKKPSIKDLLPYPVQADHGEYSMIFSQHDEKSFASPSLLEISLQAIQKASSTDLTDLSQKLSQKPYYPNIWPGEHYKLLSSFVQVLKPSVVIEIGTATGLSALALKKHLPEQGKIFTFDLFSWKNDPKTILKDSDFADGRLVQYVDDLTEEKTLEKHRSILEKASLIFIDAKHDGLVEEKLLKNLEKLSFSSPVYILFDDIRVWTMLKMWREISLPKLDLTSFGHCSGTGIVEIMPTC
jgi:predicted O-methyltransferase YrrM